MNSPAKVFLLLILFISSANLYAQRWKGYRYDIIYGIGASNFLGELGGANQIGTHVIRDFEWKSTRETATVGLRYRLNEYLAARANLTYGRLSGNDKYTKEYFRNYRNLNFFSNVYEFSTNFEAAFMKEQTGKKYRLRGVRGRRGYEIYSYFFAGIGVFHFNPRTRDDNGQPISLQPLHTEGESLIPSRKPYHRTAVAFPVGLGFKYAIDKKWSIGLEYGLRYTFTDYIDDVSTTYVDPTVLLTQNKGDKAKKFADRSTGNDPGVTAAGQQRGDPKYNDAYMFATVTLSRKLKTTKGGIPKF